MADNGIWLCVRCGIEKTEFKFSTKKILESTNDKHSTKATMTQNQCYALAFFLSSFFLVNCCFDNSAKNLSPKAEV
jgi:hypothetical protein